jgi:hypothetical protein
MSTFARDVALGTVLGLLPVLAVLSVIALVYL